MNVRPLNDRILIKRLAADDKTPGGIIIPDNAKEKPQKGVVVAIGPDVKTSSADLAQAFLRAGDQVLFAKYTGAEVTLDGVEHVVLREDDLIGVIEA